MEYPVLDITIPKIGLSEVRILKTDKTNCASRLLRRSNYDLQVCGINFIARLCRSRINLSGGGGGGGTRCLYPFVLV